MTISKRLLLPSSGKQFAFKTAAKLENLPQIHRFVKETAAALGLEPSITYDVRLAVEEVVSNVILHSRLGQAREIELEIWQEESNLVVRLRDNAPPFDPTSVPPPDLSKPLEGRPFGGAGIHLIRQIVDEMSYRVASSGGNELTLIKRMSA